jgi:hypothetical protein
MPLTPEEVAFLGPVVAEYADLRVGPAWTLLRERGIAYTDLVWLMEAYQLVDPPRLVTVVIPDGRTGEVLAFGREPDPLPECPWPDADAARWRNGQLEAEVQAFRSAHRKEAGK